MSSGESSNQNEESPSQDSVPSDSRVIPFVPVDQVISGNFDESEVDRIEIKRLHDSIVSRARVSIEEGFCIGEILTKRKAKCGHGKFESWLEANVEFTSRTARRYMDLFLYRDLLKSDNVADLTAAEKVIRSAKLADRTAKAEAAKTCRQGESHKTEEPNPALESYGTGDGTPEDIPDMQFPARTGSGHTDASADAAKPPGSVEQPKESKRVNGPSPNSMPDSVADEISNLHQEVITDVKSARKRVDRLDKAVIEWELQSEPNVETNRRSWALKDCINLVTSDGASLGFLQEAFSEFYRSIMVNNHLSFGEKDLLHQHIRKKTESKYP